jgi:gluconolactonase
MNFYLPPPVLTAVVQCQVTASLRCPETSEWASTFPRHLDGIFLEGPVITEDGELFCADVGFGRILKIGLDGQFQERCQWDGEPNGLAIRHGGKFVVADYEQVSIGALF